MNQRPIMPEDLVHYRWISQPVISLNGQVAYVEQTIDQDKNEYNTQIRGISSMVMKILHFRMEQRIPHLRGRRMGHNSHSFAQWMVEKAYGRSIQIKTSLSC